MEESVVRTDIFDYAKAFEAYRDKTQDELNGLTINHNLLKSLQDQGLFCSGDRLTLVADIGCGEGDTIINCLKNLNFKGGLDIRAIDSNPMFIADETCSHNHDVATHEKLPVARNFLKAKEFQIIPLKNYRLKYGDMVQSNLAPLLYSEEEMQQSRNRFDIVYFSHSMYYANQKLKNGKLAVTSLLDQVFNDLLSDNGMAILIHNNVISNSGMSIYAYSKYMINNLDPSFEERKGISADCLIQGSCNELGLTYYEIPFKSDVCYSQQFLKHRSIFKDINRFHEIRDNNEAIQDLYRLMFAHHRPIEEDYTDPRGWPTEVDLIADLVEKQGCTNMFSSIHVVLGRKASPEFKRKVEIAVTYALDKRHPNILCSL